MKSNKSNTKKRVLAIVLCMVLMLSSGISTMADGEVASGTPAPESGSGQEPAAASVEGEAVQENQEHANESSDSEKSTEAQEEISAKPGTEESKGETAADVSDVAGTTELVGGSANQTETSGQELDNENTEQENEIVSEATELTQEFIDETGNVTQRVTANIPEGAFQADASEITMEVNYLDEAAENHLKELMTASLPENELLGDYILYDIKFKVNGAVTEPLKAITITFEGSGLHIEDTKKANVFYLDPADPEVQGDKDEIVEITQKSEMIENLQNAGQSIENIDEYDLSEISVKEDGTADKIQMDGRISTVYGCYTETEPEPVQVLTYEDDDVRVNVSADTEDVIPEGASLKVVPILKNDKETRNQYKEVEEKLLEKQAEEDDESSIIGFLAYDITFVDADGNKVEPNGNVKVSMEYKKEALPEDVKTEDVKDADVTVLHLEENKKGEVKDVVDMSSSSQLKTLDTTESQEVQKAEFVTDSFSYFTVTWTAGNKKYNVEVYLVSAEGREELDTTNNFPTAYKTTFKNTENKSLKELGDEYQKYLKNSNEYTYISARLNSADGQRATSISYNNTKNNPWQYYDGGWKAWDPKSGTKKVYLLYTNEKLTTVDTLDSTTAGITMRMTDYKTAADGLSNAIGGPYGNGTIKKDLLKNTLDKNGYPVTSNGNTSLSKLFSGGKQVNHLFRKDIYEDTGYYEYSSFENYAYLGNNSNFTVYDQIGTPSNANNYFYQRGNFMPYNAIKEGVYSDNTNVYDEDGKKLSESHPRYDEKLYKTQDENNYYFGMYMEANFLQPKDGIVDWKENESPMRYEFNGDDDMWIYIDNVLVLDIGGIHDAHSGYIDFKSGKVAWKDCTTADHLKPVEYSSTIKEMFWEAKKFPDGTAWINKNDPKVDDYFDGDTFKDFSTHSFKMFYMERGGSASNLHMKMNLPIIPEGSIEVKKELTNTDKEKYANVQFAFQVYAQKITGTDSQGNETYGKDYVLLNSAVNPETDEPIKFQTAVLKDENGTPKEYDNVFFLKPDESARFLNLQSNRKYYVVEIGVNAEEYDKVIINGMEYVILDKDGEPTQSQYNEIKTEEEAVGSGKVIVYQNSCSIYNQRELRITKHMSEGQTTTDTFTFKIQLTNQENQLVPYANGDYYLTDADGNYYYYDDNGKLQSNGKKSKVCGQTTEDGLVSGVPQDYTVTVTQILSGTSFKVEEVGLPEHYLDYNKELVKETYEDSEVDGADGKILLGKVGIKEAQVIITNRKKLNTLHLQKRDAEDLKKVLEGAEFKIEKQTGTDTWENVQRKGKDYIVTTDKDGKAVFSDLNDGIYRVTETKAPDGYVLDESAKSFIVALPYKEPDINNPVDPSISVTESSQAEKGFYYVITKNVTNNKVHWDIIKRSSSSKDLLLEGAEFLLQTTDKSKTYYGKSGEKGIVQWYSKKTEDGFSNAVAELEEGTYKLTETKAPVGYALSSEEPWEITIGENGSLISIKSKGVDVTDKLVEEDGKLVHFYFENTAIYALPSAGGEGIFGYLISGILLMMAGALFLYKNKHGEVLGK